MAQYRIVHDKYCGYEAQARRWWWPLWWQIGFTNTHSSVESAEEFIEHCQNPVVKTIDATTPPKDSL